MLRLAVVFEWCASFVVPATRDTEVERVDFPDFQGEWLRPPGAEPARVVLLHGGGFFCCGLRTHRRLAARIGERGGEGGAVGGLPAAARHSPVGVDGRRRVRLPLAVGAGFRDVVLAGDSAGGFLAVTTAPAARDGGLPRPSALVVLSPLVDLDHVGRAAHPNLRSDAYIPAHRLPRLRRSLLSGMDDSSPARRDLSGLPPVLIQAGGAEALLYDAELLAGWLGWSTGCRCGRGRCTCSRRSRVRCLRVLRRWARLAGSCGG